MYQLLVSSEWEIAMHTKTWIQSQRPIAFDNRILDRRRELNGILRYELCAWTKIIIIKRDTDSLTMLLDIRHICNRSSSRPSFSASLCMTSEIINRMKKKERKKNEKSTNSKCALEWRTKKKSEWKWRKTIYRTLISFMVMEKTCMLSNFPALHTHSFNEFSTRCQNA